MAIENVRADPLADPPSRYGGAIDIAGKTPQENPLDSLEAQTLHGQLMNGFLYEKRRQAGNRNQMAIDHDYYDSIQLTDEDVAELIDRGQPLYVYNLVKRAVDWVIGTEKRTRIDYKVLARGKNAAEVEAARNKTDLLKYLSDVNKSPFHRSQAFRESVISGLGWMESGVRGDDDEEPIYTRKESWRNILHDSHALELDNSDAKYLYRFKYVDQDVAEAYFPTRKSTIAQAVIGSIQAEDEINEEFYLGNRLTGEDYLVGQSRHHTQSFDGFLDNSRDRVKLIECWYKKPVKDTIIRAKQLPMMHGSRYDAANDDHRSAVLSGDASVIERVNMGVFYCVMTEGGLLAKGRSPYRHNQFPFTPFWCYRRGRDNAPYGFIRPIRDPQDGFNARMRKALFALSAYRVVGTSDAIAGKTSDWEDLRNEAGRPDAMIIRKKGSELAVEQDRGLAEGHMKLAEMDAGLILDSSGVTADNLGMESNAQSGKAIIAKQSEGSSVTAEVFDNLRFGNQIHGEKDLSLTEQFVTDEREIRITDGKGRPTWKKVNEVVQNPDGTTRVLNDIAATKGDFVIDQQDFNVSLRQAGSEQLMEAGGKFAGVEPRFAMVLMEMGLDMSNLPDKDEAVKRLREMTGYQSAADAQTPEEQAAQEEAKAAQQSEQQKQAQMQEQAAQAEIGVKIAAAEKNKAEAEKILAEAEKVRLETEQLAQGPQGESEEVIAARDQLQQANEQIATLRQKEANRQHEIDTNARVETYKADRDHAARVHESNTSAEAQHKVAQVSAPLPRSEEQDEALADVMQMVEELAASVAEMQKGSEAGKKENAQALEKAVAQLEKTVERIVAANKPEKAEAPAAAAHSVTVHAPITIAMPEQKGKTVTLPDGSKARIDVDKEKPEKKKD